MFKDFKKSLSDRLDFLIENSNVLYQVDIDKDAFWELYLESFPPGTNEVFRTRRAYDCSCCRSFIKNYGNIVGLIDNKKVSIWDVNPTEEYHKVVAQAMREKVMSLPVANVFYSKFAKLGTDNNRELTETGDVLVWEHFYYQLPNRFVNTSNDSVEALQGTIRQTKEVIERSMKELTFEALNDVLELIESNTLYRGEEHKSLVSDFMAYKVKYEALNSEEEKSNYCWLLGTTTGRYMAIRNTAIGTLLINLSEGMELDLAVRKYEQVVAPTNYKRPKAIFTEKMKKDAQDKLIELGLQNSLGRRYAKLDDISIQNVLWASGESKNVMKGTMDTLFDSIGGGISKEKFKNVKETSIEEFVQDILPNAETIELLLDNKLNTNLVSLIAPEDLDAPSLFKWDNGFSWSYNGDFTDSIKEAVKTRGGKVDGVLRFSLSWAEGDRNDNSDLDAHCRLPNQTGHIYYVNKQDYRSGGMLDVDIQTPVSHSNQNIVENITWASKSKMPVGDYQFIVENFALRGSQKGFTAEVEFDGEIFTFEYDAPMRNKEQVEVVVVHFDGTNFSIKKSLPSTKKSKEVWNVSTMKFLPVTTFMFSPNHWDNQGVGNRHYFFMLEDCVNNGNARGFFNEFLKADLEQHRKVFEALGNRMRVEFTDDQLSGVGFSSTLNNTVTLKVNGNIMNINFNTKTNKNGKLISKSSEEQISL